jgi:hypothetical protein
MSCSSDKTSFVIGSTPFSAIYFSTSLLSKTQFDNGEIQGCSGTSLLTKQIRIQAQMSSHAHARSQRHDVFYTLLVHYFNLGCMTSKLSSQAASDNYGGSHLTSTTNTVKIQEPGLENIFIFLAAKFKN